MTQSVVARVVGSQIHVATPRSDPTFKLNLERCRRIPDRRWNPDSKTWSSPSTYSHAAAIRDLFGDSLDPCDRFRALVESGRKVVEAQRHKQEEPPEIPNCPLPAWRHQRAAFHFAKELDACLLYMAMGTGKSAVVIHLIRELDLKKVLILCPLSVIPVWPLQFGQHFGSQYRRENHRSGANSQPRRENQDQCANSHVIGENHDRGANSQNVCENQARRANSHTSGEDQIFCATPQISTLNKGSVANKANVCERTISAARSVIVVNYESAWREPLATKLLQEQWDLVVLDESHKIKSPGSKISMFCRQLRLRAKRRLCLTGTPTPNNILDYYGQMRFLEPAILGTSFARFRARYAVLSDEMINGRQIQRVIGFQNQDELAEKISTITFHAGEDVVELPEKHHVTIPVTLSKKERAAYDKMNREFVIWLKNDDTITATNVLVQVLRLQQIASGFIQDRDRDLFERIGDSKERALSDIVEGIDEPIAVFCQFREDLDAVQRVAKKYDRPYGEISGRRHDVKGVWTDKEGDMLAVQIQAGGLGIDLTRGQYGVYYSLGYSLGDYEQSYKRLHRPGQNESVTYFHLVGQNTVDEKIYRALASKKRSVEDLVAMLV